MPEDKSERHDRLTREFIMKVVRETDTMPELMVIVESMNLSILNVLQKVYNHTPANATTILEESIHTSIERFAKDQNAKQ